MFGIESAIATNGKSMKTNYSTNKKKLLASYFVILVSFWRDEENKSSTSEAHTSSDPLERSEL